MDHEKIVEPFTVSYNDTGYKLDELERIFDKKVHQRILKKKHYEWTNIYLFFLAALKSFKYSSKNCHESVQEIIYALEKLEKSWSWFNATNKIRFHQLVRYHVLKHCDIDIPAPQLSLYTILPLWKKRSSSHLQ